VQQVNIKANAVCKIPENIFGKFSRRTPFHSFSHVSISGPADCGASNREFYRCYLFMRALTALVQFIQLVPQQFPEGSCSILINYRLMLRWSCFLRFKCRSDTKRCVTSQVAPPSNLIPSSSTVRGVQDPFESCSARVC